VIGLGGVVVGSAVTAGDQKDPVDAVMWIYATPAERSSIDAANAVFGKPLLLGIAGGLVGAAGVVVLLQGYGRRFPTTAILVRALVTGLVAGIALPSLARVVRVRRSRPSRTWRRTSCPRVDWMPGTRPTRHGHRWIGSTRGSTCRSPSAPGIGRTSCVRTSGRHGWTAAPCGS